MAYDLCVKAIIFFKSGFSIVINRKKNGRNDILYLERVPKFGVDKARKAHSATTYNKIENNSNLCFDFSSSVTLPIAVIESNKSTTFSKAINH